MTISRLPVEFAHYKWDNKTGSGYILRLDVDLVRQGLPHCIRIEDWHDRVIVNEWMSDTVDDAVHQLAQLFNLDAARETNTLQKKVDSMLAQTAPDTSLRPEPPQCAHAAWL